jgi:hypothetical protein
VPRWYFPEESLVDVDGVVHRPDCPKAVDAPQGTMIAAGEEIVRRVAPKECRACQPTMEMLLGHGDSGTPPREIP